LACEESYGNILAATGVVGKMHREIVEHYVATPD
jgi:hypothetical protein